MSYYEYEPGPWDDDEDVTCKFCGMDGLEWIDTGAGFRLLGPDGRLQETRSQRG